MVSYVTTHFLKLYGQADFSYICERDSHASYSFCLIEAFHHQ